MRKFFVILLFSLFLINFTFAETTVDYYYGLTCPHCIKVSESGVLERLNQTVPVTKYETWYNVPNGEKLSKLFEELNVPSTSRGVPFLLINCSGKVTYLVGDTPIISNAESYATTCNFNAVSVDSKSKTNYLYWGIGIVVVLVVMYFLLRKKN